jgi:hypothetical protein
MPEVLTKHPDIVIAVLEGGGARCGPGQEPKILKACPPARFCATSSGETCVYGLEDIGKMTQISREDLAKRVCDGQQASTESASSGCTLASEPAAGAALVLGTAAALIVARRIGKRRR